MKKLIRSILSITLVFSLFSMIMMPCFAVQKEEYKENNPTIFSEYEYIVGIRKMSKQAALESLDLPLAELETIISSEIEKRILKRKEYSDDVLINYYGYKNDEIAILRKYNGERLEDYAEIKAITGTLTINKPSVILVTPEKTKLQVTWSWDHCPIVCISDVLAMSWDATFSNGIGNLRLNSSESAHVVNYYPLTLNQSVSITPVTINHAAKSVFTMSGPMNSWAKTGVLTLCLNTAYGSGTPNDIDFLFVYGHTVLGLSPSVSFDFSGPGVGISMGRGTSTADYRRGYVRWWSGIWYDS